MKRPQPDLGNRLLSKHIGNVSNARKLKRLWGTQTINGVEVLVERQYYYPTSRRQPPKDFEKVMRFLGTYNDVVDYDPEGIKRAWFYLNKNKVGQELVDADQFIADNLNLVFWDPADGVQPAGVTLTTSIVIERELGSSPTLSFYTYDVPTTSLLNPSMTEPQMIQAVQDNYETLWNTCLIKQAGVGIVNKAPGEIELSPDDPWLNIVSRYALKTAGIPCTIKSVEVGLGQAFTEANRATNEVASEPPKLILYNTYVVTLEIPAITFSPNNIFIDQIAIDIETAYKRQWSSNYYLSSSNGYYSQQTVRGMSAEDLFDDPDLVNRPYTYWEDATLAGDPRFNSIWVSLNGRLYLRADAIDAPRNYGLTYKELSPYLFKLMDTGYKKKKAKWYKKAIAIIIFIVSIVLLRPDVGIYFAIAYASLILVVLSIAFSAMGMEDWAMAFAEANKTVEPLVMVATIMIIVTGITAAIKEAAAQAGGEVAKGEAVKLLVQDYVNNIVNNVIKGATDVMAGDFFTNSAMKFTIKLIKLSQMPAANKLEDINSRNKDLQAEYDKLVQELSQENDALKGFMNVYAKPATADWSIYAEVFDMPYERGGGNMALGNVQRTTKQALRKGKYDDPAFENILVV